MGGIAQFDDFEVILLGPDSQSTVAIDLANPLCRMGEL